MKTPYERLDKEVRGEWLDNPVTEAFLGTLLGELLSIDRTIVANARAGVDMGAEPGFKSATLSWVIRLAKGELANDTAR